MPKIKLLPLTAMTIEIDVNSSSGLCGNCHLCRPLVRIQLRMGRRRREDQALHRPRYSPPQQLLQLSQPPGMLFSGQSLPGRPDACRRLQEREYIHCELSLTVILAIDDIIIGVNVIVIIIVTFDDRCSATCARSFGSATCGSSTRKPSGAKRRTCNRATLRICHHHHLLPFEAHHDDDDDDYYVIEMIYLRRLCSWWPWCKWVLVKRYGFWICFGFFIFANSEFWWFLILLSLRYIHFTEAFQKVILCIASIAQTSRSMLFIAVTSTHVIRILRCWCFCFFNFFLSYYYSVRCVIPIGGIARTEAGESSLLPVGVDDFDLFWKQRFLAMSLVLLFDFNSCRSKDCELNPRRVVVGLFCLFFPTDAESLTRIVFLSSSLRAASREFVVYVLTGR